MHGLVISFHYREADFLDAGEQSFQKVGVSFYLNFTNCNFTGIVLSQLVHRIQTESSRDSIPSSLESSQIEDDIETLKAQIERTKYLRLENQRRRTILATELHHARLVREALSERVNTLSYEQNSLRDQHESLNEESTRIGVKLQKCMQMNAINDAFYIWYAGPFGTINNFRLGNLSIKPIEWTEKNAALGQAVLAVSIVAAKAGFEFKKYTLQPMGSFPTVYKSDDRSRRMLPLYWVEGNFALFPKSTFNSALIGFLTCVHELGDFIRSRDPTLALPYFINLADKKIFDQVFELGTDDDKETWTRAMKFLLTDIKWVIAWATKHC